MGEYSYKEKIIICFSLICTVIVYILLLILNYNEYDKGIKYQEKIIAKKLLSNIAIKMSSIEERANHEIEAVKFVKNGILATGYLTNNKERIKAELFLNTALESENKFIEAYVLFKDGKKDINVYDNEKALELAESAYKESIKLKREFYISEFDLSIKKQFIALVINIDENSKLAVVYNFKYIGENFIENGDIRDYTNYYVLDQYGNIVYGKERDRIGENIFVINSENEELKKRIRNYIEKDSGVEIENIGKNDNIIGKITAWSSLEIENKKIILCATVSNKEIEIIALRLKVQNRYINYLITLLFITVIMIMYYKFKRGKECKVNVKIKKERDNLEFVINESNSTYWEYYSEDRKIYFSEKFYEITGYNRDTLKNNIDEIKKIVSINDLKNIKEITELAKYKEKHEFSFECMVKKITGKNIWFLSRGKLIEDEKGKTVKIVGFLTDITELKQKESELMSFKIAVEQSPITIVFTDAEGKITFVNKKFTTLTGYTKEEALGENPRILKSERHNNEFYRNMWDTLLAGAIWSGEVINRKKNGELYYEKENIAPITDEMKRTVGYVAIKEDITRQKEVEIKMEKFATRDELTGVFNRRSGLDFLEQQIKVSNRNSEKFSVIYVDVNNLKYVNDNLGHSHGDSLIVEVCGGIKEEIRGSDILTRLGGDEFMVVMPNCDKKEAEIIWRRVAKSFEYINNNFKKEYVVSASHGVYEYVPGSNSTVDTILEAADREMYIEKKRIKAGKLEEKNV